MLTYWEELSASALKSEQKREITNYLGNQKVIYKTENRAVAHHCMPVNTTYRVIILSRLGQEA